MEINEENYKVSVSLLALELKCQSCISSMNCEQECEYFWIKRYVEKQKPIKPIKFTNDYSADFPYTAFKCPVCNSSEELYDNQPYCSECGQRLDWEGFNGLC